MAVMDPLTLELLSGPPPPLPGCGNRPATTEFEDAFLRAIGALPPLPHVNFAPTPVHHAAAPYDSIELPATCELYAAEFVAHLLHPAAFELLSGPPLPGCGNGPTTEFDDAFLRAIGALPPLPHVNFAPTPVHHAAAVPHDSIEHPATCELSAAEFVAHLLHPAVEVPVTDSKNSTTHAPLSDDYDADIDVNLREMEKNAKQRPSPDYMKTVQGGRMSQRTRAKLINWMEGLILDFDLAPGTLHRAVSYVDRFLSERTLSPTHMDYELHLVAATAVYTAAKYEEQYTRSKVNAADIAWRCGFGTTKEEVIDMELTLLATLRYELGGPTAYTFVHHFTRHSKGGDQDLEVQRLAHHFAETSLIDYKWLQLPPSAVAASAVYLARLILDPTANQVRQWNKDFEALTGYKHTDLIVGIETMSIMHPDPRFEILPAFFRDQRCRNY